MKLYREDAMESLYEGLGYKEIVIAYRGIELPPNSDKLNRREYLNFFNNYNGEYYFKEGTPQWFSCYSCISTTYGSWVVKAKLQLNNICDLTDKKVLHTVLPNFFNKIKKEILQYYKGEELERQLSIIDKCSFNYIKDNIYLNWKDVIDEIKKQGYDSIKSLEESEDLMYIDNGYIIWSMNNIIDYKVLYYDCYSKKYYTIEQYKEGMDSNGSFWCERLDSEGMDDYNEYAMESTIKHILKNAGVKLNESLDYYTSVKDSYGDELHCRMTVSDDGKDIGYLDFSVYEDTPYIQMINVKEPYRRKGYATQMIKQLQKQYPNSEIDFGMTTDDGTKLVNSLSFDTKVNIEYDKKVKQAKKLKKWLDEFKEFTDKVYQQIDNNEPIAEKNRLYIVNNTDKWQKYKNKYEELLDWIRENKRETKFVKINEVKNLNESVYFNDEVYNEWNEQYEHLKVILNPSIDWLKNELNKPDCWGFRFLHNTEDNLLYIWDCHQSFMHQQVFDIIDPKWGKSGTNVIGIFEPEGVRIWEEMADDGEAKSSIALAKKLDGKLFNELYPNGYEIGLCN